MVHRACSLLLLSCIALGHAFVGPRLVSHGNCAKALAQGKSPCRSECSGRELACGRGRSPALFASEEDADTSYEEEEGAQLSDEEIVDGVMKMKISEIRAELDMRGVDNTGITSKGDLARMLLVARNTGIADPSILDFFTRENVEQLIDPRTGELVEEYLPYKEKMRELTAGDGTLPGGLTPDQFEALASNPDLMRTMQNPKIQAVLKRAMSRGADSVLEAIKDDPELDDLLEKASKEIESLKYFK